MPVHWPDRAVVAAHVRAEHRPQLLVAALADEVQVDARRGSAGTGRGRRPGWCRRRSRRRAVVRDTSAPAARPPRPRGARASIGNARSGAPRRHAAASGPKHPHRHRAVVRVRRRGSRAGRGGCRRRAGRASATVTCAVRRAGPAGCHRCSRPASRGAAASDTADVDDVRRRGRRGRRTHVGARAATIQVRRPRIEVVRESNRSCALRAHVAQVQSVAHHSLPSARDGSSVHDHDDDVVAVAAYENAIIRSLSHRRGTRCERRSLQAGCSRRMRLSW